MSRPRVFVTRRIAEAALQKLAASVTVELFDGLTPPSADVVLEKIRGCQGVLSMLTERIDARVLDAALDVTDPEPPAADEPLLKLKNVLLAPHLGSATVGTRTKMAMLAVENLLAVLEGRRPAHVVNPEVL